MHGAAAHVRLRQCRLLLLLLRRRRRLRRRLRRWRLRRLRLRLLLRWQLLLLLLLLTVGSSVEDSVLGKRADVVVAHPPRRRQRRVFVSFTCAIELPIASSPQSTITTTTITTTTITTTTTISGPVLITSQPKPDQAALGKHQ